MLLLEVHPELEPLVDALRDVDESEGANKAALVKLLKSTGDTRDALLADLIDRYDLAKKTGRGRPRRPAYVMSDDDLNLAQANGMVTKLVSPDCSLDEALERAAAKYGTTAGKLSEFRMGRRRSVRR